MMNWKKKNRRLSDGSVGYNKNRIISYGSKSHSSFKQDAMYTIVLYNVIQGFFVHHSLNQKCDSFAIHYIKGFET